KAQAGEQFGLLPVDMDEPAGRKNVTFTVTGSDGALYSGSTSFIVVKKKFPVQRLSLPESQVTLSKENLARHQREKALLREAFERALPGKHWNGFFMRPIDGQVSTPFGVRRFMNDIPKKSHSGVDIQAPSGKPVSATSDGVVALTGDRFFSGKSVFVDHGMGIFSMYFHLSQIDVKPGQRVACGEVIGRVGSTGRSTGPHLHWGIRILDQRVDPLAFVQLFAEKETQRQPEKQ
ncbi:M23 family metallopeptidase, partial [Thermodesulfobacteriota bacterium]